MRKSWNLIYIIFGVLSLLVLNACGGASVIVHKNVKEGTYPLSVAILPFTIGAEVEDKILPPTILRRVFFAHFRYLGYSDLPLDSVDQRLKKSGYNDSTNLASLGFKKLRKSLGTDAVIKGHILNANNFTGGIYAETWIKVRIEMIDLRSGMILWETEHQERDQSSIISPTVLNIIQQQIENADKEHAYQKISEEFALQVVSKIPDPADQLRRNIQLPKIQNINVNFSSNPILNPGDSISVVLNGEQGMMASFDIGSWKTRLPMKETSPGIYKGKYLIQGNDQISNALVIGRLTDHYGKVRKKVFKGGLVTTKSP